MTKAKIRVLVVEDSLTVRKRLCEVLARDPEIEIVGEAEDGKAAIELCLRLKPDVITMDMMMPVMSGLSATEYIMAHSPTPILVVSSSTNRGDLFKTYDALAAGAVDVVEKALWSESGDDWERRFLSTLKLVSRIRVITHLRARLGAASPPQGPNSFPPRVEKRCRTIAIGASTGGPGAIVEVLKGLPTDLAIPILLVLHINELLAAALADWLEGSTGRPVAFARDGDLLSAAAGRVIVAPPSRHMLVRDGRLRLSDAPERHSCRPSIDVLFESVAREIGPAASACLLTGMGRDGAAGLLEIRKAGGFTIAQDEATSVVYGMPREAVLLDAAERVLPLGEIGPTLGSLTPFSGKERGT